MRLSAVLMVALSRVARTALRDRQASLKALVAYTTVARDAGGMLPAVPRSVGAGPGRGKTKTTSHREKSFSDALSAAALDDSTAARWQQLAKLDDDRDVNRVLYRLARTSRDVEAVEKTAETGNPKYVTRRARNGVAGRALARIGFWRRLWR